MNGNGNKETVRALVINGDDFGLSHGVNLGIIEAHEHGVLTSASLMVHGDGAAEAGAYARRFPKLGVGLHLDLGEWEYRDRAWIPLYEVVPDPTPEALTREIQRQVRLFRELVGRDPDHVDSHQHVHRDEPLRSLLTEVTSELAVPVRQRTHGIEYCGGFYGQTGKGEHLPEAITLEAMTALIERIGPGVTELGCHPAREVDFKSPYSGERLRELEVLCHPAVRSAIEENDLQLCSFAEANRLARPKRRSQ